MNLNNPNILKQHNFAAKTTSLFSYLVKAILLCAAPVMLVGFVLLTEFVIHHERVQDQGDYLIAKEISDSIDAEIMSHIKGLELLAASSTLNDPVRLNDFYNEMQAFHAAYDSHLILADPSRQMLLNTRAKYGATLPKLPTPTDKAGRGGFVIAQATGKPGIGDIVFGPVAKEPLINIAVPVKRDGESRFFLLNTFGASRFERMVSGISLPEGYSFVLVDGAGLELALNPSEKSDALKGSTIVVKSDLTSWSVSLSTPGSPHYRQAAVLLVVVLAVALGATLVGASIVAGKIANSVRSLSSAGIKPSSGRAFTEVESARANLLESDRVQKQALDSLRASEETLRRRNESFSFAQEAAKSGAYEWDVVTNKTVWSDQLWPILGLEKNSCESNYDNWLLSIHPDDRDKANLEVGEALQEKKEINTQWRLMDPQGQIRWVVSRAKPILNDRGEVLRYVGIVIDITDQKLVEESLNDSRERLHMALDAAQAGMWEWNLIDNSVYWSEELWSLYGLEPHSCEQSYENWFGTIHPDDRERVRNQILEAVNNGGELNTEWRVNEPSGGFRYLMSRGKLCTDGQGQSRVYRGVVVDITERKLMQDELIRHRDNLEKLVEIRTEEARESQRLLQTIIDFLPMEVTYLDADGKYVFTNRTFQTWWGKTPQEICGKTPEEVHGEQANFVLKEIADARTGHEQSQQLVYSHPDGTTRHLWTKVTLENRHDGTLKGIVRIAIDVTEIKKAQEALQESEALFRSLFENMPDGIVLISPDGTLDKVNPAAGSILGMSEDEIRLLGRDRILDVVDPRFVSARERLLLTGKVSTELNCRRNDGTIFPIDVTTSFVPDSGGSGKTIISFRDVTDRKLAEKALLESEARLRAYFEAPLLGVASVTPEMRFIDVNDFFCEMLGYSRQELMGMTWPEFTHPEDLDTDLANYTQLLDGKINRLFRIKRHLSKDGSVIWVKLSVSPISNEDGSIKSLVVFVQDMSDEKRLEQALEDSLAFLERLLEAVPNPIWVKNTEGIFLTCNKAFEDFVGLSRDQIVWKTIYDVSPRDIAEECSMKDGELWDNPGIMVYESFLNHHDGALHPAIFSKATFKDSTGKVAGQVGIIQDISERTEAERERSELQEQLHQSRKLASIGTLVGGIAHDFNNMLQIIIGYGELLMDEIERVGANPKLLKTILHTAETAAEQVTKFMDLGQQSMVFPSPTDLNQKIRELESTISNLPNINQLEMDLFDGPAIVKQDPGQLGQIIMSMANNASEAMPDGGTLSLLTTTVTLDDAFAKLHYGAKAGPHILLTVTDTGKGIDEAILPQIFDPFFSTKERGDIKGMGLGLSVMRGIVQQRGGFVTCESKVGKGTTFRVYFPEIEPSTIIAAPDTTGCQMECGKGILIVEDSELVAGMEQAALEAAGYEVLMASNGREAVNIYRERQADIGLVILDIIMPEMDGRDCIMELMKINPLVKAIVLTGHDPKSELSLSVKPYVISFLPKPCRMRQLVEVVQMVIEG